jgi:hypothetical protein
VGHPDRADHHPDSQPKAPAAHHAARRSTRRRRGAVAILALLTALAVAASGFAFSQRATAVRQRDQASYNQVVAEALQYGASDTMLAAQLNLAAYRIQPTQDLASRLLNTENTPLPSLLAAGAGSVNSVAFSPDGHALASGSDDGTTRLWNLNIQHAISRICAVAGGLTPQQWHEYIRQPQYQTTCVH